MARALTVTVAAVTATSIGVGVAPALLPSSPVAPVTAPATSPAITQDFADPDVVVTGAQSIVAFSTESLSAPNPPLDLPPGIEAQQFGSCGEGGTAWCAAGSMWTALPASAVPSWVRPGSELFAPFVYLQDGRYLLYYDAVDQGTDGRTCIGVASASQPLAPGLTFAGSTNPPVVCMDGRHDGLPDDGGSVDPSAIIDHATGTAFLQWKTNGAKRSQDVIWSAPLDATGLGLAGSPTELLALSDDHAADQVMEAPDLVYAGGTYDLFFAAGTGFQSPGYDEKYADCVSELGPCSIPTVEDTTALLADRDGPTLWGPGSASVFTTQSGAYIAYSAWPTACDSYNFIVCPDPPYIPYRYLYISPLRLPNAIVAMAATSPSPPTGTSGGYWEMSEDGEIWNFGDAALYQPNSTTPCAISATASCSEAGGGTGSPFVALMSTPDARGYWEVDAAGDVFGFGDARYFGSLGCEDPPTCSDHTTVTDIVGAAATPDGGGYWVVGADGGVFAFGDAGYAGSLGGQALDAPIVGLAAASTGTGYWLVGADGGVFAFGQARYCGSMGGQALNAPVVSMAVDPASGCYVLGGADGGVYAFGAGTRYLGSMGAEAMNAPVVAVVGSGAGAGYWLVGADGGIFGFGGAGYHGAVAY